MAQCCASKGAKHDRNVLNYSCGGSTAAQHRVEPGLAKFVQPRLLYACLQRIRSHSACPPLTKRELRALLTAPASDTERRAHLDPRLAEQRAGGEHEGGVEERVQGVRGDLLQAVGW